MQECECGKELKKSWEKDVGLCARCQAADADSREPIDYEESDRAAYQSELIEIHRNER